MVVFYKPVKKRRFERVASTSLTMMLIGLKGLQKKLGKQIVRWRI